MITFDMKSRKVKVVIPEGPLPVQFSEGILEAGLDEAGRGCLAGPVVAGAVIFPSDFSHPSLNDSKKLTAAKRLELREIIFEHAIAWGVGMMSHHKIDEVNILNASYLAMHEAAASLEVPPEHLLVDGNRFRGLSHIPHTCMVKGDARFLNIAAASILAKTYRDEIMEELAEEYPQYGWSSNKGYPTPAHKRAVQEHGLTPYHRLSFNHGTQLDLFKP